MAFGLLLFDGGDRGAASLLALPLLSLATLFVAWLWLDVSYKWPRFEESLFFLLGLSAIGFASRRTRVGRGVDPQLLWPPEV